jgi:glycosyltransferase involved in cell wall biosynthesis
MRIFHLIPNLNYGGLQRVVQLLVEQQLRAGHSVTIGCWTNASNHPEVECDLQKMGARSVYLRRRDDGGMIYGRKVLLNQLKTRLGPRNADILHIHNPFGYYIYGALAARAAGGTKVVNTIHITAMFDHPNFGRKGRAQFWAAAMLSDGIVSVCDDVENYVRRKFFLPGKKFFTVDNGIDFSPYLAVPARCPRDQIVFGFAGRMAPEKNHHVLLKAFALARRKYSNIRLRLLGSGKLEPELRELSRDLELDDVVEFRGFGHDVPGFLADLDVYVLPSLFEALPMSLLEAIASGLPVVATKVGAVPQVVERTNSGWLCAPDSAESLLAGMESAIASSNLRERGELARQRVVQQYSSARMASDYERLYEEVRK